VEISFAARRTFLLCNLPGDLYRLARRSTIVTETQMLIVPKAKRRRSSGLDRRTEVEDEHSIFRQPAGQVGAPNFVAGVDGCRVGWIRPLKPSSGRMPMVTHSALLMIWDVAHRAIPTDRIAS
jgi:hypothetical protein